MRLIQLTIYAVVVLFFTSCAGPMFYTYTYQDYKGAVDKGKTTKYLKAHSDLRSTYFVHSGDSTIQLTNVLVSPEKGSYAITGDMIAIDQHYQVAYDYMEKNRYIDKSLVDNHFNYSNQSHIFVNGVDHENGTISLASNHISGYHLYRGHPHSIDRKKTGLALGLGIGLPVAGLATLIGIACNCPHVYISDGTEFHYTNTMFTGAISSKMERFDIKRIPDFLSQDELSMRIVNEDNEIQYINLSELQVVSHSNDVEIVNDQSGNFYSIKEPIEPNLITTNNAILESQIFNEEDEEYYAFNSELEENLSRIKVEFNIEEINTNDGRLILAAKNSDWAGIVYKSFIQLFGDKMDEYRSKNANKSREKREAEFEKQGVSIVVEVNHDGEWRKIETINLIGATNFSKLAVNIPNKYLQKKSVEFRLSTGFRFWDLDYMGFDNSSQNELVIDNINANVKGNTNELDSDDSNYLTLNKGEDVELSYNGIPKYDGLKRTLFIRSKGYYESQETGEGPMQKSILIKMNKKGGLSIFSKELYSSYMESISQSK